MCLLPTGLAGQTPVEQALADAIVDTIDDFMMLFPWAEKNQDVRVRQSLIYTKIAYKPWLCTQAYPLEKLPCASPWVHHLTSAKLSWRSSVLLPPGESSQGLLLSSTFSFTSLFPPLVEAVMRPSRAAPHWFTLNQGLWLGVHKTALQRGKTGHSHPSRHYAIAVSCYKQVKCKSFSFC